MASDAGFRLGTGVFAAVLVSIVVAIGFELSRQSMLSIQKFGFSFWRTEIWDPVAGEFGALPFIWGTLYSSFLALLISTPIALGIAVFVSDADSKAHWVEAGRCYERFALQATVLGIRNAFLNQPVEVANVRPQFAGHLGVGSRRPDLVVRFGRGPEMPRSLRRPVEAVIV
jgi:hypothetical protein